MRCIRYLGLDSIVHCCSVWKQAYSARSSQICRYSYEHSKSMILKKHEMMSSMHVITRSVHLHLVEFLMSNKSFFMNSHNLHVRLNPALKAKIPTPQKFSCQTCGPPPPDTTQIVSPFSPGKQECYTAHQMHIQDITFTHGTAPLCPAILPIFSRTPPG